MMTQMPIRRIPIIAAIIVCVCLAAMPACDDCETKSSDPEYRKRQYRRALIVELCRPGTYYVECIWHTQERCHLEIPMSVVYCVEDPPVRPGQTLREALLECVLRAHFPHAADPSRAFREECVDPTRWAHIPPNGVGILRMIRETWYEDLAELEMSADPDDPVDGRGPDDPNDDE